MGSGLSGGPLTGQPVTAALAPAPAGTSAVLSGPLGAGATDVVTKIGSTVADASVNAGAKLTSIMTGIGATEVEQAYFDADGNLTLNVQSNNVGPQTLYAYAAAGGKVVLHGQGPAGTVILKVTQDGVGTCANLYATGRLDQSGTDSTGTPGNATINKPTGKSAIAIGAASVTITCSLCAAASRVMITPHARDATCTDLIVVPGAGSFVVSGAAAATAAVPFSWEVSTIL